MILDNDFENKKTRDIILCKCDYCGNEFNRVKRTLNTGRKITNKDACGDQKCINAKIEESNLLRYGVKNAGWTPESQKKIKQTCLERYGNEVASATPEFQEKNRQTRMRKYGAWKSEETKEKTKQTLKEKYGDECFFKTDAYKENMIQNHGVEWPSDCPDLMKQGEANRKKTLQEKHGIINVSQLPDHNEKCQQTCIEKYGEVHYSKTDEYNDKVKQTSLERFGETHYTKTDEFKKRVKQTCIDKYGIFPYTASTEYIDKHLEEYGVPYSFMVNHNQPSKKQLEIQDWINSLGYNFKSNYTVLNGKEIDLYDESVNLGIEYCGLYWHSENSPQPRTKNYHYNKYQNCLNQNVKLITIFSDEWQYESYKCKNIIKSNLGLFECRIGARKCSVSVITNKESNNFCKLYHIRNAATSNLKCWGLFNNNELIGIMSLGRHPRKSGCLVLNRLCFKANYQIIGGVSKLFKQCKLWAKDNGYKKITSWSDNRWSNGDVYSKLEFILDEDLLPDYSYIKLISPTKRISKQSQKKSKTNCPKNITERSWAIQNGFSRIWDCGKKRWIFNL